MSHVSNVAGNVGKVYTVVMAVHFIDLETGEVSDTDPRPESPRPVYRSAPPREYARKVPRGYRIALWWSLGLCVGSLVVYAALMGASL
jgi:hypothetical protein